MIIRALIPVTLLLAGCSFLKPYKETAVAQSTDNTTEKNIVDALKNRKTADYMRKKIDNEAGEEQLKYIEDSIKGETKLGYTYTYAKNPKDCIYKYNAEYLIKKGYIIDAGCGMIECYARISWSGKDKQGKYETCESLNSDL